MCLLANLLIFFVNHDAIPAQWNTADTQIAHLTQDMNPIRDLVFGYPTFYNQNLCALSKRKICLAYCENSSTKQKRQSFRHMIYTWGFSLCAWYLVEGTSLHPCTHFSYKLFRVFSTFSTNGARKPTWLGVQLLLNVNAEGAPFAHSPIGRRVSIPGLLRPLKKDLYDS